MGLGDLICAQVAFLHEPLLATGNIVTDPGERVEGGVLPELAVLALVLGCGLPDHHAFGSRDEGLQVVVVHGRVESD